MEQDDKRIERIANRVANRVLAAVSEYQSREAVFERARLRREGYDLLGEREGLKKVVREALYGKAHR